MSEPGQRLRAFEVASLLGACAAVELMVHAAGVSFDAVPLENAWPLLPVEVLQGRLLQGLLHLHSQPPLFNWLVGVAVQIAPSHQAAALHVLLVASGVTTVLATAGLARALGAGRFAPLAGLFVLAQPAFLLYEHHLGYEVPLAAALTLAALLLARAIARPPSWALTGFFGATAAACLLRSLFPLPFFLLAALLAARALGTRRTMRAAALPLCLLVAWQIKNVVLFGVASGSSWLGMNISRVTVGRLPPLERRALVAEGKLSQASLLGGFQPIEGYPIGFLNEPAHGWWRPGSADAPELREPRKRSGAPNFNHEGYIAVSRALFGDALRTLALRPDVVASALGTGWLISLTPSSQWGFLAQNRRAMPRYLWLWERVLSLEAPLPVRLLGETQVFLSLLFGIPWLLWRALRSFLKGPRQSASAAAAGFCALCIATVLVVGNTFEVGENQRFHAPLAPLLAALLLVSVAPAALKR